MTEADMVIDLTLEGHFRLTVPIECLKWLLENCFAMNEVGIDKYNGYLKQGEIDFDTPTGVPIYYFTLQQR